MIKDFTHSTKNISHTGGIDYDIYNLFWQFILQYYYYVYTKENKKLIRYKLYVYATNQQVIHTSLMLGFLTNILNTLQHDNKLM